METKINYKGINLTVVGEIQESVETNDHFSPAEVEVEKVIWNEIDVHDLLLDLGVMDDVINEAFANK